MCHLWSEKNPPAISSPSSLHSPWTTAKKCCMCLRLFFCFRKINIQKTQQRNSGQIKNGGWEVKTMEKALFEVDWRLVNHQLTIHLIETCISSIFFESNWFGSWRNLTFRISTPPGPMQGHMPCKGADVFGGIFVGDEKWWKNRCGCLICFGGWHFFGGRGRKIAGFLGTTVLGRFFQYSMESMDVFECP